MLHVGITDGSNTYLAEQIQPTLEDRGHGVHLARNRMEQIGLGRGVTTTYYPRINTFEIYTSVDTLKRDIPPVIVALQELFPGFTPEYTGLADELTEDWSQVEFVKGSPLDKQIEKIISES